jgi:thiamine-phosphate pyrophosphorylase
LLLYYITDRTQFPGNEAERRRCLLEKIAVAARCGIDYIQLREKDLSARDLEALARQAVRLIRENAALRTENQQLTTDKSHSASENRPLKTRLLVNSRTDVALASGADGVHLRSDDISASEVREVWRQCNTSSPLVANSCHTLEEVQKAAGEKADFVVFAPVFEKRVAPAVAPAGLEALRQTCGCDIPVLALGGVTLENARQCLEAGAAGIAAVRLFQENEMGGVVQALRT